MTYKESLGDHLCEYCPLEKKGVYSVNGGSVAGCEGSKCNEAYENYLAESDEDNNDTRKQTRNNHDKRKKRKSKQS